MNDRKPTPLIAGNWKMNGSQSMTRDLIGGIRQRISPDADLAAEILVCPPTPYLALAASLVQGSRIVVGAQDCHVSAAGAHTGDVSAQMLADCGARYVILGHSERRADHDESSKLVCQKAVAAIDAGLTAIVCVGETLAERDAGKALEVVQEQLEGSLPADLTAHQLVVAYEPVWAIGTGRTASTQDVIAMHAHIRKLLMAWHQDGREFRIIYGGSVKPQNAGELLGLAEVNGALVGGASLKADDFWAIATAA